MLPDTTNVDAIARRILDAAAEVHRQLGPGLLESIYLPCLQFELSASGLRFVVQRKVPIIYKGLLLDDSYRVDLIVENRVVVELKSVAALTPVHESQALTYLRLTGCPLALLINFNVPRMADGIRWLSESPRLGARSDPPSSAISVV